ncbi:hypothetical protein BH24ACT3_BH24ACT3_05470 [soil metagenome]
MIFSPWWRSDRPVPGSGGGRREGVTIKAPDGTELREFAHPDGSRTRTSDLDASFAGDGLRLVLSSPAGRVYHRATGGEAISVELPGVLAGGTGASFTVASEPTGMAVITCLDGEMRVTVTGHETITVFGGEAVFVEPDAGGPQVLPIAPHELAAEGWTALNRRLDDRLLPVVIHAPATGATDRRRRVGLGLVLGGLAVIALALVGAALASSDDEAAEPAPVTTAAPTTIESTTTEPTTTTATTEPTTTSTTSTTSTTTTAPPPPTTAAPPPPVSESTRVRVGRCGVEEGVFTATGTIRNLGDRAQRFRVFVLVASRSGQRLGAASADVGPVAPGETRRFTAVADVGRGVMERAGQCRSDGVEAIG